MDSFGIITSAFSDVANSAIGDAIGTIIGLAIAFFIFIIVFKLFVQVWLFYQQSNYKKFDWTLFEIRVPREVNKTPRAMEQFLMNIHGLRNAPGDLLETYKEGEVTLWWSLEICSFGGEIHLYIRTPKKHKKMIEAGLYAQYPTAEVVEIKDYMDDFPMTTREVYQKGYNFFGSEIVLRKESSLPITTYEQFELSKEELAMDPISAILEVLSGIQKEESVFIQMLIRPIDGKWKGWQKEAQKTVDKLLKREKKEEKTPSGGDHLLEWTRNIVRAPIEPPTWTVGQKKKEEKKEEKFTMSMLSFGEKSRVEAIEGKLTKPAFETLIRFLYYAPKSIYSVNFARRGLIGAFNQYSSPELNSFRSNSLIETRSRWVYFPHVFVDNRVEARRQRILFNYRNRILPQETTFGKIATSHIWDFNTKSKSYVLTTAEVATLFHIPAEQVLTSPHIKRMESKKMGPPAGLPIFKDEK